VRLKFVACAVLCAALALVAAPGNVGSRTPSPVRAIEAAAFQPLQNDASGVTTSVVAAADPALRSANAVDASARFAEPLPDVLAIPLVRAAVRSQPVPGFTAAIKPPKYTVRGVASFYNKGTTAMRLPAGTIIRVCGAGGCLDRVVNDWGPSAAITQTRVIDMYRPDFFAVCGCASWSGITQVTVSIY
jgi:hypothetical protein